MTDFLAQFKINLDTAQGENELQRFNQAWNKTLTDLGKTDAQIQSFYELEQAIRKGEKTTAELDEETKKLISRYQGLSEVARSRDFLGLESHAQVKAEVQKVRAAYDKLKASGQLTSAELGQAALRTRERIVELEQRTTGWVDALDKSKFALAQTIASGAGLASVVRQAVSFEAAMADVNKVVDGTPEQIEDLGSQIKALSRELPVSAEGLAQIAAAGGQLGVPIEQLGKFTELAAKMSVAFNITADQAGQVIGKLSNVFGLTLDQVEDLTNAINVLGNTTGANEAQLIDFLTRVGGTAQDFGLAAEEAAALGATLIELGKPPEVVANAVNAMLSRLQTARVQSKDFQEALIDVGTSADEMAERIRANPQIALRDFLKTLESLDAQSRSEALTRLFGREYQDDISLVVQSLDAYEASLGRATDASRTAGAVNAEFAARMATNEAQLQLLKNAVTEAAINLGTTLLPAVNLVAGGLTDATNALADFVEEFPNISRLAAVVGTASISIGGLKTAFAALQLVGGRAITGLSEMWTDGKKPVSDYVSELGKARAAFNLLSAAIVGYEIGTYLYEEFELARIAGTYLAEGMVNLAAQAKLAFEVLKNPLNAGEAWAEYRAEVARIGAEFDALREHARNAGKETADAGKTIETAAKGAGEKVGGLAKGAGDAADESKRLGDEAKSASTKVGDLGTAASKTKETFDQLADKHNQTFAQAKADLAEAEQALKDYRAQYPYLSKDALDALAEIDPQMRLLTTRIERQKALLADAAKADVPLLEAAYKQLGVTSQAALDNQAASARKAFDLIVAANAPIQDQVRAWEAVAQAELAAAAAAGQAELKQVQAALKAEAKTDDHRAALEALIDSYSKAGDAADSFGTKAVSNANRAAQATQAAASATSASSGVRGAGSQGLYKGSIPSNIGGQTSTAQRLYLGDGFVEDLSTLDDDDLQKYIDGLRKQLLEERTNPMAPHSRKNFRADALNIALNEQRSRNSAGVGDASSWSPGRVERGDAIAGQSPAASRTVNINFQDAQGRPQTVIAQDTAAVDALLDQLEAGRRIG